MITRLLLSILASAGIWCSTSVFAQDEAPAPNLKHGQWWQYRVSEVYMGISSSNALDGVYELRVVGEKVTVNQVTDGKKEPVTARSGVLRELVGASQAEEPDLKFPLSAGQKRSYTVQTKGVGAKKAVQRNVEISVSGPEQVTTSAGTFKAFKVVKDDRGIQPDRWVTTHYWSPETNGVVKSSFDSTAGGGQGLKREIELLKFSSQP